MISSVREDKNHVMHVGDSSKSGVNDFWSQGRHYNAPHMLHVREKLQVSWNPGFREGSAIFQAY